MVIKVTANYARMLGNGYWVASTSAYQIGTKEESIPLGKIVLSIKNGKRRKLVCGRIVRTGIEAGGQGHPGYDVHQFVPNNEKKFLSLVGRSPL